MTYLARLAELVINQPLMILPEKLAVIASVLEGRINIDASDLKALMPTEDTPKPQGSRYVGDFAPVDPNNPRAGRKPYRTNQQGVAIIPVHGSLVNRGGFLDAMSGITSYEKLKFQIDAAADDSEVASILLDIDSGGGEAVGAFETGDAVRLATAKKQVVAHANGLCCSAAYAIASGASRIISSKSSIVGSIGTALLHLDRSKQLSDAGIKPTLFTTGKRKGDGSPFFELSDEVKGELRSYVQRVNANFIQLVVGHRGATAEALLALEAGVFIGAEAIAHGLVDEVGSFETVLARLGNQAGPLPIRTRSNSDLQLSAPSTPVQVTAPISSSPLAVVAPVDPGRLPAFLSLPEAVGRQDYARSMAMKADISIETAKAALAMMPTTAVSSPTTAPNPAPPPEAASQSWDDVVAEMNANFKKNGGFAR